MHHHGAFLYPLKLKSKTFDFENCAFLQTLPVMVFGMLGIFAVIIVISLLVSLLAKIFSVKKK